MDLDYTREQRLLRKSLQGALKRSAPPARVRRWVLEGAVDHATPFALAVEQGWTGIGIAEASGGAGGGAIELSILAEELGRATLPADALYGSLLCALALAAIPEATDLVAALAAGELTAALVHPGGRPADHPVGDGAAALVPGGPDADRLLVWDGQALAVHDRAERTRRTLVDRTRGVADILLTGPPSLRVELDPAAMETLAAHAALLCAADALGASARMLELTVEYVGQRVQFAKPVGSFQAVKHAAAEMLVAIEGTRGTVQYAAWALSAGEPGAALDAWVAKSRSARCAVAVADKALFLHGAIGYTWDHDLQLLFKRAKSDADLYGGAATYEDRIADALELVPAPALAH